MASIEASLLASNNPKTLGEFIRERSTVLGDQVAAIWFQDKRSLTYLELHERADRLASSLNTIGVRKGTHVAVMLPNVPETMIVWTAIGRIGAVMVPVNPNYTPTELSFVLNDSDTQFFIVDESCTALLAAIPNRPAMIADASVIVFGKKTGDQRSLSSLIDDGAFPFSPPVVVTGSDLLNIQYTSGTTGFPKGCMLTHDYWMRTGYSLAITRNVGRPIKNVLVWQPFFYMDGMWQILSSFIFGATTHVVRRMSMTQFFDWLVAFKIDSCTFPEAALKSFPAGPRDKEIKLEYIYAFGWRPESKREAEQRFGCKARDAYGMTELGTATVTPIRCGERNFQQTCGLPAPERKLKIVDESGFAVPPGTAGELWVGGPGIMWGYYKRPEANAESFRGAWFRTGDIFRQDDDGYYFIIGRIKEMVKRSGENIAAREVEAVLNSIDDILESAVVPVPDERRGEEVKAYIRLQEGLTRESCPPDRIFKHCSEHLARFKIPRYFEYVDAFPRTATGKIAKQQLIREIGDLRLRSFDRLDAIWR
jgi:long-chain acyl-CoA synthetase/crotonobetaine/carnitine-CoA ligase